MSIIIRCVSSSGTRMIPADFLIPAQSQHPIRNNLHHKVTSTADATTPGGVQKEAFVETECVPV